jgi:hypothetical protein
MATSHAQARALVHATVCLPGGMNVAHKRFGLSKSYLWAIGAGTVLPGPTARERILSDTREAELALADKICAEWGW